MAHTNLICVCVCLSRFYGLYLPCYGSDFDQIWLKCWNFSLINFITFHKNRISFGVIMTLFLFLSFVSKGRNSAQREKNSVQREIKYAAADCDASDSDLLVMYMYL